MKPNNKMTLHLINFYEEIAKVLKDENQIDKSAIFMPVLPSKEISFNQISDLKSTIDFLEIDHALAKDTHFWKINS